MEGRNGKKIIRIRKTFNSDNPKLTTHEFEMTTVYWFLHSQSQVSYGSAKTEEYPYKWYEFIRKYLDIRKYYKQQFIDKYGYPNKTNVLSDKSNWILLTYAGSTVTAGFLFGLWFFDFTRQDDLKDTKKELISKIDTLISISKNNGKKY